MTNKQGILGRTWTFLVASLTLWCAIGLQAALAAEPIKLGVTASLSGVYAGPGQNQLEGIKMWVHDINARGALLGRKVELVDYDDASDPDTVRRLYQRLIEDDKVDLLIGPYSSDLTLVASEVAERHDFPMVAAGAASSRIWSRGYRNIFQVDAPAREYMDLLIKSAKTNAGLSRIALIYPAAEFSREVAEGVRAKAAEQGMEIVFDEEYPLDSTDFSDLVRRMRLSAPELVIGATYLNDSIAFVQEAKRQQLSPEAMAFTVGPALPEFGNALGADADGIIGVVPWMRSGNVPMAFSSSWMALSCSRKTISRCRSPSSCCTFDLMSSCALSTLIWNSLPASFSGRSNSRRSPAKYSLNCSHAAASGFSLKIQSGAGSRRIEPSGNPIMPRPRSSPDQTQSAWHVWSKSCQGDGPVCRRGNRT